jgi:hypothetical protein
VDRHFHAYAYTGRAFTDGEVLKGNAPSNYAPFLIADWLKRPAQQVIETFTEPELAAKWLRGQMEAHPPIDAESFSVDTRIRYAERTLRQDAGADVVWGYYSGGQYVSRAMICCPRGKGQQAGTERISCPVGMS